MVKLKEIKQFVPNKFQQYGIFSSFWFKVYERGFQQFTDNPTYLKHGPVLPCSLLGNYRLIPSGELRETLYDFRKEWVASSVHFSKTWKPVLIEIDVNNRYVEIIWAPELDVDICGKDRCETFTLYIPIDHYFEFIKSKDASLYDFDAVKGIVEIDTGRNDSDGEPILLELPVSEAIMKYVEDEDLKEAIKHFTIKQITSPLGEYFFTRKDSLNG